ncbi:MAG: TRAP transporter substrate-binding protein DctP [Chloroflexi bacterium]|nr:TRAP transporter substrate-binding protein DctP [Chloroflexota bacterium]
MRKVGIISLLLVVMSVILAACGGSATAVPTRAAPTAEPTAMVPSDSTLEEYAAAHAGGPGAVYVGDLKQLVGPAFLKEFGDGNGNVPLESLQRHLYMFESPYYKSLLEKAKLANPTPLVSTDEDITIQHACINRTLVFCKLTESFFFPNVLERTNGQLKLVPSSFPELGIGGSDNLGLISDGTLDWVSMNIYVAGELPDVEIIEMFGIYPDVETMFITNSELTTDMEKLYLDYVGGKVINFNWVSGGDFFFYSNKALRTGDDFNGVKTRTPGPALGDWIRGLGAEAVFMPFAEVYTALERGILDAGITVASAGHGQRWYEVAKYINGSIAGFPALANVMNDKVWASLPPDLQQILIEEAAKSEMEALRVSAIHNEYALELNIMEGMEYVPFSAEVRAKSDAAILERMMPSWVKRVGPDKPIIKVFNEKVGPRVGMRIEPDGSVVRVPITKK